MQSSLDRAMAFVLKYEGGYVNNPKDNGGPTNKGVTLANFRAYVKPKGTIEDLKALTTEQAATVFRRHYWDKVSGAELPAGVDLAAFDFAVNSGPSRAAKFLQHIAEVPEDGAIGPKTLTEVHSLPAAGIINNLCDDRQAFLERLADWDEFGKGWTARVKACRALALQLAAAPAQPVPSPPAAPVAPGPETPATGAPAPTAEGWRPDLFKIGVVVAIAALAVALFVF